MKAFQRLPLSTIYAAMSNSLKLAVKTRSLFPQADVRLHGIANDSKAAYYSRMAAERRRQ